MSIRWDSINFDDNIIKLEATNTKSKKSRKIPICDMLRNMLLEMASKTKSVYVFPMHYISPTNETKFMAVNIMGNILSQLEDTDVEALGEMGKNKRLKKS